MYRYFLTTILVMLLSMNAWSQSPEPDPETEPGDEASSVEPAAENADGDGLSGETVPGVRQVALEQRF